MLTVNEPPPLNVYWKERGHQIRLETVCFNYGENTSGYRDCRKLASQKFKDECQRFTELYHDSRPYYDKTYKDEMDKFCPAADEFKP